MSARTDLREGRPAMVVPIATGIAFSSMSMETGMWEMPDRGTSGIVGGSDITFRRDRRVVINLSVRLASFI